MTSVGVCLSTITKQIPHKFYTGISLYIDQNFLKKDNRIPFTFDLGLFYLEISLIFFFIQQKFVQQIRVFWRESLLRSPMSGGDSENPEGPAGCLRDFQNPRRAEGIVGEDSRTKNPNLVHIFFNFISLHPQISQHTILLLKNIFHTLLNIFITLPI